MIADLASDRSQGIPTRCSPPGPVEGSRLLPSPLTAAWPGASTRTSSGAWGRFANERDRSTSSSHHRGPEGRRAFRRRHLEDPQRLRGVLQPAQLPERAGLAEELTAEFLEDRVDAVLLVYNEFVSAISQRVVLTPLLPFERPAAEGQQPGGLRSLIDFEYEPSAEAVLDRLVPQAVAIRVFRALLETWPASTARA